MRVDRTLIIAVLVSSCIFSTALAQRRGPQMQELRATGTIKDLRPRLVRVSLAVGGEAEQLWLVSVPERYEDVVFEATATPAWLRPPMPVRFNATVVKEKRMREIVIREPVSALTVAPVRPDVGMGLFPEQGVDQRDNLFTRRTPDAKKKQASSEPEEVLCLIVGRLVENKEGKLRVVAGNVSVRLELAPKAEVSVQWHDLQWVRPGDKVELTARYPAGRPGQAQGQAMTITAAKVLDVEVKTARGRRKSSQEGERSKEGKSDESEKVKKS